MDWKNIGERAGWTFVQSAIGTVTVLPLLTDIEGLAAVGLAAATAGVSSVLSLLKTVATQRLSELE
jgi:hypothetical protein